MARLQWLLLGSLCFLLYEGAEWTAFMFPSRETRPRSSQHRVEGDVKLDALQSGVPDAAPQWGRLWPVVVAGLLLFTTVLRPLSAEAIPLEMLKRLEQEQARAEAKGPRQRTEAPPVLMRSDPATVSLAERLREGGATFYGTFWCPACDTQRQLFGVPAWQSVPYVECDARNSQAEPQKCFEAGVDAIPFWTFADGTHMIDTSISNRIMAESLAQALEAARKELGEDVELKQDEDVLDTWFSSGLWPFATVGWPSEDSEDYKKYYPAHFSATMMETGYDILFFWVARMVMMGLTLTDKAPFKEIYLHGLVRDEKGQKMSKTKGNVVDPLDSIAEYGTDALRYALLTSSVPGMDVPISKGMLENAKAFANKIWNVGRFIITEYEKNAGVVPISFQSGMTFTEEEIKAMPWLERALLSKCQGLCKNVTSALLENRFAPPTKDIKEFLQEDIAAWYVEASKTRLQEHLGGDPKSSEAATSQKVLLYLLEVSLKLLHPFMPFAVWQRLPRDAPSPESLMICPWPRMSSATDVEAEGWFEKLCGLTSAVRNARAEQGIPPKERVALTFWCADASFQDTIWRKVFMELQEALKAESSALAWLARADPDKIEARAMSERPSEMPSGCIRVVVSEEIEVDLPVPEKEIDVEKEPKKFSS
eukprot:g16072.t1